MTKHDPLTYDEMNAFVPPSPILELIDDYMSSLCLKKEEIKILDWGCGRGQMVYFDQNSDSILLHSSSQKGSYLVLAGKPLHEPIARYGPFVANTEGEIKQAMLDYQSGKMGQL